MSQQPGSGNLGMTADYAGVLAGDVPGPHATKRVTAIRITTSTVDSCAACPSPCRESSCWWPRGKSLYDPIGPGCSSAN